MANREKVIKGLECLSSEEVCYGSDCPYYDFDCTQKIAQDVLELLKEQAELVRCKDCKYNEHGRCEKDNLLSQIVDCGGKPLFYVYDDWFCAYGKRR